MMNKDFNKLILIGNVGQKPETRTVGSTTVTKFSLATTERWKDKDGNKKESTDWHNVEAWGKQGEILAQYVDKGTKIMVEGSVKYDTYDKDGEKRTITKIRLSSFGFLGGGSNQKQQPAQQQPQSTEDALPF